MVLITAAACFLLVFGTSQNWNVCYRLFCFVLLLVGAARDLDLARGSSQLRSASGGCG